MIKALCKHLLVGTVLFSTFSQAQAADATNAKTDSTKDAMPVVIMKTNKGDIKIELNNKKAPKTVKNFLKYANTKFYEGTIFHRVIPGFMVQGGGFSPNMTKKAGNPPIENEANNGLKNDRGTIAMARTNDINSATSQFFINVVNNNMLNHSPTGNFGYAVFGKVIDGMDIIDSIAAEKTGTVGYYRDVPKTPIIIESVTLQ